MESILATAFGRVIDVQKGESNAITEAAATFFGSVKEDTFTNMRLMMSKFIVKVLDAFGV